MGSAATFRARLPPLALALLAAASCSRSCGARDAGPGPARPAAPSPVEAELATLPARWAAAGHGGDGPQVVAHVNRSGTGGALVVEATDGARLVHGQTVGRRYDAILEVAISPDGARFASVVAVADKVRLVLDGEEGPDFDGLEGLAFTPDGRHLAYKARLGPSWHLGLDRAVGPPQALIRGTPRMAGDGATVMVVEQPTPGGPLAVAAYRAGLRRTVVKEVAASVLVLDDGATRAAAVVAAGGGQRVVTFPLADPAAEQAGEPFEVIHAVDFDPSGAHLITAASRDGALWLALDGRAERLPAPSILERPVVNPVRGSLGVILSGDQAFFHVLFDPAAPASRAYAAVSGAVVSPDGSRYAYAAEADGRRFVVVNGVEAEPFDDVAGLRFSPDSSRLVYRARQGLQRFVVVAEAGGRTLRRLPPHDRVLDPAFTADGAAVAYAVRDGPRLLWKVERP
jgi:hypothetical protein